MNWVKTTFLFSYSEANQFSDHESFDLTETEPASPLPHPYLLESLSVLRMENDMGYPEDYVTKYLSSRKFKLLQCSMLY